MNNVIVCEMAKNKFAIKSESLGWYVGYSERTHRWSEEEKPSIVTYFESVSGAQDYIETMPNLGFCPADCRVKRLVSQ